MRILILIGLLCSVAVAECKLSMPRGLAISPRYGAVPEDFFACVHGAWKCFTVTIEDEICRFYEDRSLDEFKNILDWYFVWMREFSFYKEKGGAMAYIHSDSIAVALMYSFDVIDVKTYNFMDPLPSTLGCMLYDALECVDPYAELNKMQFLYGCFSFAN